MAQDDGALHFQILNLKRAPLLGPDSQKREESRRHGNGKDVLRRPMPQKDFSGLGGPGAALQLLETSTMKAPFLKGLIGGKDLRSLRLAGGAREDPHESAGVLVGQWPEHHGMDDAEDRRVRADPQAERKGDNQREAGIFRQHSRAVAQVLPKLFNPSRAASVAAPLFRLLHAAERPASGSARLFRIHPEPDVLLGLTVNVMK